jgi:hypothetical protein
LIDHLENDGKPEFPAQVPEQLWVYQLRLKLIASL